MSTDDARRFHGSGMDAGLGGKVGTMARRYQVTADSDLGREMIAATACPACQAPLGLPCTDQVGEQLATIHEARGDAYDDGLLAAIEAMANAAARATQERDQLIVRAVEAGLSSRQIGAAASITHTSVQYIARRDAES